MTCILDALALSLSCRELTNHYVQAAKLWRPYADEAIRRHVEYKEKAEINRRLDLGLA